ncbi:MAG: DNA polymerase III subunit delta [Clostridiales bacterium]|nr:DNA polymerase III subunit delta [Clostridiales bacterium]
MKKMPMTEAELKKHLKEGELSSLYFLYGEEGYLTAHYAAVIAEKAAGGSEFCAFNLQKFDGQDSALSAIGEAAEALPLMADKKCVVVRDWDAAAGGQAGQEQLLSLIADVPETCVLIFWQDAVKADVKKNARWKAFAAAVEKKGIAVCFPHKSTADIVRLLTSGAGRRGCTLSPDNARLMVERSGDDLNLLLNELDKLCALAQGEEISRQMIEAAGLKNLEASVFDLAKMILQARYEQAYHIIHCLMDQKEEPVSVLSVLSSAYADLYRAKAAAAGGVPASALAADFQYKGREFRLRNAARDCARLSLPALRASLEVLARADLRLKSSQADKRTVLEQTAAELIVLAKGGMDQ